MLTMMNDIILRNQFLFLNISIDKYGMAYGNTRDCAWLKKRVVDSAVTVKMLSRHPACMMLLLVLLTFLKAQFI